MTADPREAALAALQKVAGRRADDRDDWLKVGMALHSASPDLLDNWDKWSQQSEKYQPGKCAEKWPTFEAREPGQRRYGLKHLIECSNDDNDGESLESVERSSSAKVSPLKVKIFSLGQYLDKERSESDFHWDGF